MAKKENKLTFFILSILVAIFSYLQFFDFSFLGASPSFAIVGILVASFFIFDFFEGVFLSAFGVFFLKFSPVAEKELIIFFMLSVLVMFLSRRMPWSIYLSFIILMTGFVLIFYSLILPSAILSQVFFKELVYNILIGIVTIFLLQQFKSFKQ